MNWSILIVDDEPMTLNLLRLMLEREGFRITEATNGRQAIDLVGEEMPDLMILDVMMPGMDGITVCQNLRAAEPTANLPIIMLSAKTDTDSVQTGLEAGADKYLSKMTPRKELVKHIRELLAGGEAAGE